MKTRYLVLGFAVLLVALLAVWYTRTSQEERDNRQGLTYGEYAYTCDGGVEFMLTLSPDLAAVTLQPVVGAMYPEESILVDSATDSGRRFVGAIYELHARGETVTLYDSRSEKTYTCEPQPKPNEAPLNFGD